MDANIVAVVGSLGGVLLGFLLNGAGALLGRRHEETCRLRRALYSLLKLYHLTIPPNLKELSSVINSWIRIKDPGAAQTMTTEGLCQKMQEIVPILITPLRQDALQKLCASYEPTVDEIASVDPLLAFSLSGRSRIQADVRQYMNSVEVLLDAGRSATNGTADASRVIGAMKDFLDTQLCDVLRNDIKEVARRIGWRTRRRVSKQIKRIQGEIDPDLKRTVFAYLDGLLLSVSKRGL